jgi:hypothetical protein
VKISARIKLVVISALLAAIFVTGSAWADVNSEVSRVVSTVTAFGLKADATGNTITIVNTSTNPLEKNVSSGLTNDWRPLDLGDIPNITIDWKANVTVSGDMNSSNWKDRTVIWFENGTFNMMGGKIDIQTTGSEEMNAIEAGGKSTVTVNGGTLTGEGATHIGIGADSDSYGNGGKVIVKSGKVYFPKSLAITTEEFIVEDPSVITGFTNYSKEGSDTKYVDVYGEVYADLDTDPFEEDSAIDFTVKNGAKWTWYLPASTDTILGKVSKFLIEENGGLILNGYDKDSWLDIDGTFTNKGKFINNTNVYNGSANSFYNYNPGMLINNGYILNGSKGKMSTGTIDNTNGTIENEGVFESVQTPEEMGGEIEGPVQLIGNTSSGGGCDAGFGMFGLLFAGLAALKKRRVSR